VQIAQTIEFDRHRKSEIEREKSSLQQYNKKKKKLALLRTRAEDLERATSMVILIPLNYPGHLPSFAISCEPRRWFGPNLAMNKGQWM
jgi:hypothetical protein